MVPGDGARPAATLRAMAPLGRAGRPQVQIFGLENDQATRAAIRFFKERRIEIHLVDLRRKPIAAGRAAPVRRAARRGGAARPRRAGPTATPGSATCAMDDAGDRRAAAGRLRASSACRSSDSARRSRAGRAEATWKALAQPGGAGPSSGMKRQAGDDGDDARGRSRAGRRP